MNLSLKPEIVRYSFFKLIFDSENVIFITPDMSLEDEDIVEFRDKISNRYLNSASKTGFTIKSRMKYF